MQPFLRLTGFCLGLIGYLIGGTAWGGSAPGPCSSSSSGLLSGPDLSGSGASAASRPLTSSSGVGFSAKVPADLGLPPEYGATNEVVYFGTSIFDPSSGTRVNYDIGIEADHDPAFPGSRPYPFILDAPNSVLDVKGAEVDVTGAPGADGKTPTTWVIPSPAAVRGKGLFWEIKPEAAHFDRGDTLSLQAKLGEMIGAGGNPRRCLDYVYKNQSGKTVEVKIPLISSAEGMTVSARPNLNELHVGSTRRAASYTYYGSALQQLSDADRARFVSDDALGSPAVGFLSNDQKKAFLGAMVDLSANCPALRVQEVKDRSRFWNDYIVGTSGPRGSLPCLWVVPGADPQSVPTVYEQDAVFSASSAIGAAPAAVSLRLDAHAFGMCGPAPSPAPSATVSFQPQGAEIQAFRVTGKDRGILHFRFPGTSSDAYAYCGNASDVRSLVSLKQASPTQGLDCPSEPASGESAPVAVQATGGAGSGIGAGAAK